VQLQAQQQALLYAQNAYEKDLILLKRETGIDPGQKIILTDPAPYSDLAEQTPEEVRAIAYKNARITRTCRIRWLPTGPCTMCTARSGCRRWYLTATTAPAR